jgi:hypothetical protein
MPLIGASQYTSGFSPTTLPDCTLWLDAADATTLTLSGSNVTGWRDKSGTGRTVTFSNSCTYTAATPSVDVNITAGGIFWANVDLRKSTVRNANIFIVYSWSGFSLASTSNQILWGADDGGGWNRVQLLSYPGASSFAYGLGYQIANPQITAVSNLNTSNRTIYSATYSFQTANGTFAFVNGVLSSARVTEGTASPETTVTNTYFGGNTSNSTRTSISFNEIIILSNAISPAQRQGIEGYLARKWGVTSNLPATHPFRSLPPFSRPFQPTDISGCAVWLDSMDPSGTGITPSSGTAITTWIDKSGSGRHGTNAGTGTSTMGTTSNTGRPTVVMGGSNYFRLSNASTLSVTSASYFVQAFATGSNRTLLSFWNNERILGPTYYWDNATNTSLSPYSWSNTNAVLSIVENSSSNNCTVHFNGNALTGPAYKAATANSNVILGAHWSLDNWWLGNIQEVILYDGAVTPGQRQQVETYLMNKWGTRGATPSNHYARLAPALSLPFNPLLLGNCSMWLDAADSSVITLSGSNVTAWNDKSGNGRNATVSSNAYATLTGTPQGLLFSNSFYTTTFSADPSVETGFVVYNMSSNGILVGAYNAGREIAFQSLTLVGPLKAEVAWGPLATSAGNVRQMVTTFTSSTATSAAVNGGTAVTGGGLTFTSSNVTTLGREVGSNFPYGGYVYEIILFNANLTTPQRQITEGYLAWKWGFPSSLPSTHPWRTVKP